ncbi:MAG: hypothetical protein JWN76_398 [Chitinophagaceae bacterium]|nr:hypothetical protein [Chitinophagaceae bacterium]
MKLFLIRYTKLLFIWLRLHGVVKYFNKGLQNLAYLSEFSQWVKENKPAFVYNDFPSKWNYEKRYLLYEHVFKSEELSGPVNYLEFGVATGQSFKWWTRKNTDAGSRFYGFDTFTGLPEDWGPFKKGSMSTGNVMPDVEDERTKFYTGLFQQTLPEFISTFDKTKRNVIMMDADLYSSTLFVLTVLAPYLKKGDLVFFDEFVVPMHEFKAYLDFIGSYYMKLQPIAAANNYYFVAFKVS